MMPDYYWNWFQWRLLVQTGSSLPTHNCLSNSYMLSFKNSLHTSEFFLPHIWVEHVEMNL